jgi:two-component system sensor histidine kinase KdpD
MAIDSGEPAGRWTSRLQPAEWTFFPVRSSARVLGAMGLARDDGTNAVAEEQQPLLTNLLDQLALALERSRLEREAREFGATRERDRIRSALLSSIGQDLTPRLTAIGNAVRALKRGGSADRQLLSVIGGEASKLDRYIANVMELGPETNDQAIVTGEVTIDLFHRSVAKGEEHVHLTPKEFALLAELAKHRGRVLTHAYLLRAVWGPAQDGQIEYLRVAIRGLRRKLESDPSSPSLILNEPAVGYRLAGAIAR